MIKGELTPDGESPPPRARSPRQVTLDPLSKRIIERLQVDGRRSYAGLAEDLGVSQDAVQQRVRDLVDAHVIKIVGISDARRLGFTRQAMLGLHVEKGTVGTVAQQLIELPEVVYMMSTTGPFDILAEIFTTSDEHLATTLDEVHALPHVVHVRPYPYVRVRKQTYCWTVR